MGVGSYIGVFCFLLDTKLYSINVDSNNKYYSSVDGILLNKDKTEIVKYPNKMQSTYDIPNTVTDILPYAFRDDTNLQYISLPQNITTVGYGAFMDCPNLVKVTLPTELTTIDSDAFGYLFRMGGNIHVNDFKIYGYKNTAAEKYAQDNGFEFIALDDEVVTGDSNQDGIVNVKDVTYLQRHLAGSLNTDGSTLIDETSKALFDCLDLNKDGKLTVADVTELQVYISTKG